MITPHLGRVLTNGDQRCGFSPDDTEATTCPQPAAWHICWGADMECGLSCETHMALAQAFAYLDRHPVSPDCDMPGSEWSFDDKRCIVEGSGDTSQPSIALPLASEVGGRAVTANDVIKAWEQADPTAIHPLRQVSEDAYWESGRVQADMLATVIPDGAKVMDFGCGDGRVAIPLAGLGYEVTAVDSSQKMLDRLTERAPDITTVQAAADGIAGHLGRRKMDAVYSLAVLIHHSYADCLNIVAKLRAATKLGGILVLDWPLSDQPSEADSWIGVTTWSPQLQADACARIGLEPVDSDLPWGVYQAVRAAN